MSELDMITVIFITSTVYMCISSWHLSRLRAEVHKILEKVKGEK